MNRTLLRVLLVSLVLTAFVSPPAYADPDLVTIFSRLFRRRPKVPPPPPLYPERGPILFVGDSHVAGAFGLEFDRLLRVDVGSATASYGSCGSTPAWWFSGRATNCGSFQHVREAKPKSPKNAPTPLLRGLLAEHRPAIAVVELGINLYGFSQSHIDSTVTEMIRAIRENGSECVWIGPTHSRIRGGAVFNRLYESLERLTALEGCHFVDSRPFLDYPATGGDGLHWDSLGASGRSSARLWANRAFERMGELLGWQP